MSIREKHDGQVGVDRVNVRLWLRLLSCSTVIEKRVRRRLSERGATLPRFDVMATLDRNPDGLTMSALSRLLLVSNGNVTAVVQALSKERLVQMEPSPTDGRVSIVRLTEQGQASFDDLAQGHHRWIDAMFKGMDKKESEQLFALLGVLKASIADEMVEENELES
ncbi:MarR family winged helix-turn-helix transcriptional regulator [Sphingobium boeckii]|uniref:DNA-binding MarR family transcriptional regulator n=1 Tax=Sphingobium boeckii TaxID=1082345 RepID=A0A7W9AK32_9SPHN|nr:DNA-binding MarR family transcriptional regulator [Sphingobium boeckii]